MFISGLLAFLQTVFIPGFILLKYTKTDFAPGNEKGSSKIRQLVYGFGLSLLINYILVFLFTITGIYKPLTLYILLFSEGALLVYYYWKRRPLLSHQSTIDGDSTARRAIKSFSGGPGGRFFKKAPLAAGGNSNIDTTLTGRVIKLDLRGWLTSLKRFTASNPPLYNLLLLISALVILWYAFLFVYFLGGVFEHWDPAVGWNPFALDWAANRLPGHTWHYPQLIPTNWSISYVILQTTDVQCFAKAFMSLFSIGILLLFLDLALRKKKNLYLLGLILYGMILAYIYDPSYIVSGYVDIAVSFFGFLSFHVMHGQETKNKKGTLKTVWWAVVFASAAAVTKQSGLFILVVMLVWTFIRISRNRETLSPKKTAGVILAILLTVSVISVSWYVLKEIHIKAGQDRSEVEMVQQAHRYNNYTERFNRALTGLATHRHPKLQFLFYAGVLLMLLGVFHRRSRWVVLFITLPYTLIWGFLFSYDSRNLAPAIPFIAFAAAGGAAFLKRLLPGEKKLPVLKIPVTPFIVIVLSVLAALNFTLLKNDTILRQQIHKKKQMGDAELNALLYRYHKKKGLTGKIATNYQYIKYLPGLERFYKYRPGRVTTDFLEYLETPEGKDIHYLLAPKIHEGEKEVFRRYREKQNSGRYRLVFKHRGYWFIKVK